MGRLEYWLNGTCREIIFTGSISICYWKKSQLQKDKNFRYGLLLIKRL